MSSPRTEPDPNDSVICLDASLDTVETVENHVEQVTFDQTLPPGIPPDGFIILDETAESEKIDQPENPTDENQNDDSPLDENQKDNNATTEPMFKVFFRDQHVSKLYRKRVKDLLRRLASSEPQSDDSDPENLVLEVGFLGKSRKRSRRSPETRPPEPSDDKDRRDVDELFTIEKSPAPQDRLDVPAYGKKFERIMDATSGMVKPKEEEEEAKACNRSSLSCWNCEGNHSIRDCTEPRDPMTIAKNRNKFTARSLPKVGRYHVENDGGKSSRFVPGRISNDLKRALGIRDNQLPYHIYRMRMLGYPPGWLKEARLEHSGMNLYDSDGFLESRTTVESGEIAECTDEDRYDAEKIQEFPGFNVRPPSGTREDNRKYWTSDRYATNSKESMLVQINARKTDSCTRKRLKRHSDPTALETEQVPSDMDIVQDTDDASEENVAANGLVVPPLSKDPPKPPLPCGSEDGSADSPMAVDFNCEAGASPAHADSPSLAELEHRKRRLLEELNDSSAPSPPATPVVSGESRSSTPCTPCVGEADTAATTTATTTTTATATTTATTSPRLCTPSRGTIKSVDLGTPILESSSPYSKLPAVANFAKDISDFIQFENLPDSTGKYQHMTGILAKVRNKLATNHQN